MRVLVAVVTELCTHLILQWYETHTMLCNGMKCIPVLILKSQRHTFSQTNNFSQINKFFVICECVLDPYGHRIQLLDAEHVQTFQTQASTIFWRVGSLAGPRRD